MFLHGYRTATDGSVFSLVLVGFPAEPGRGSVSVHKGIAYARVNGTDLRLDVYEPAGTGRQLRTGIILIHGGGWTSLHKRTMSGMGQFLARNGYVGFSVDYRLFDGTRNRWPAQLDDVQHAVCWIRANAATYHVDPSRIGAFGHSAGAQLAALLGMEETRETPNVALSNFSSKVQAVVDHSGPSDFTRDHDAGGDAFFAKFLGSTDEDAWQSASPVFHVAKNNAPCLIVHGTRDQEAPLSQPQELYDKPIAAGVPAEFVKVDDVHTFQTREARRQLALATLVFFNRYLAGSR